MAVCKELIVYNVDWMQHPTSPKRDFSILAVDGGGTRGIYAAQILAKVEEALGQPVRDCFDLLAGTSKRNG